jgi:hypothetical protein
MANTLSLHDALPIFGDLVVIFAEAQFRRSPLVAKLQLIVLGADVQLLTSTMVAFQDRLGRAPVRPLLAVVAPKLEIMKEDWFDAVDLRSLREKMIIVMEKTEKALKE